MIREEFKKKYNNTKVYIGKHSVELYKVLNSVYGLRPYNIFKQYPFAIIKNNNVLYENDMMDFKNEPLKEVSVNEIVKTSIHNHSVGDIIIFDNHLAVVKCVTADRLYIGIYMQMLDGKVKVMPVTANPNGAYPFASTDQINSFFKEILS